MLTTAVVAAIEPHCMAHHVGIIRADGRADHGLGLRGGLRHSSSEKMKCCLTAGACEGGCIIVCWGE